MTAVPEPAFTTLSVFFLLGVVQAFFLALALITSKKGNQQANPYLAAMLIIFAVDLFNEFLDSSLYGLQVLEFMFISFTTDMLYGPLIWLYVRSLTGNSLTLMGFNPLWHFLPFAIHAMVIWSSIPMASDPLLFTKHPELLTGNQIQPWIMNETFAVLAVIHIAVYLSLSLITLRRHAVKIGNSYSYIEGVGLKWLRRLLGILFLVYLLYVFRIIFAGYFDLVPYADVALNIGMVVLIYSLGYFGVQQPLIFASQNQQQSMTAFTSSKPEIDVIPNEQNITTTTVQRKPEQEKYTKSSLHIDAAQALTVQLKDYMELQKPYLDNKLNLAQLATQLGISSNHLSQVINEQFSLNFFDFINGYRIEAAKNQLINTDPKRYTVLGLALDSGFNSKSAFYTGFKKQTGMTPTQFRNKNLAFK